ncbi:MAG TPA: hypothetical protein DDZ96_02090 [Porphyromonadaceae bacterium]|nr:hypothetical protein [Porphyromonadaceae bacterium]
MMKEKLENKIWIIFCALLALFHIGLLIYFGNPDMRGTITVFNLAYALIFITAIIHEVKLNKILFYVMAVLSLLLLIYGSFFTEILR